MVDLTIPYPDNKVKAFFLSVEDSYTQDVKHFIKYLNTNNLELNFETFKDYATGMYRDPGVCVSTYNKRVLGCKKRIKDIFASELNISKLYFIDKILNDIPLKRYDERNIGEEKILSIEEYNTLAKQLPKDLRLMTHFGITTGCRISEMLSIIFKNIHVYQNLVMILLQGKGGKQRKIKLQLEFFKKVLDYFHDGKMRADKVLLFHKAGTAIERTNVTNRLKQISKRVLKRNVYFHMLRHSWATNICKKEPDRIVAISRYMGHASTGTTYDYYFSQSDLSMEELYP